VPLKGNPLKELNSYLIRGKERNLLIDTGFRQPACREAMEAGLKELGVARDDTDVLLTHMHSDHSGLAPEFVGKDRHIYVSSIDKVYLDVHKRLVRWEAMDENYNRGGFPKDLLNSLMVSVPARSMAPPEYEGYRVLSHGDVLEAGGYRLTALLTPGHTPGHMCYWMEEQGVMFTGDHILFDITPNITAWVGVENSLSDYMESLRIIRKYPVKLALPGHRAAGDFNDRIGALLRHYEARLAECLEKVREKPGMTVYETASRMTWQIRARNWEDFPDNQKWFATGECMSHLDYLRAEGKIRRETDGGVDRYFAIG
jgi:glyoxylase-like metal-dependent hydrolase (beta-lactamase superfamily II)